MLQWPKFLNKSLLEVDPELFDIIEHEKNRQYKVCPEARCSACRDASAGLIIQGCWCEGVDQGMYVGGPSLQKNGCMALVQDAGQV